ncbi:MAG TPA: aldehyde dehydrogenase family protein, partial [Nevskiaceae bacterium]|nr:aldehyde dehydrogenase family protein [Nevskiaceae bacterium]
MVNLSQAHLGQRFVAGAWQPIAEETALQPLYNPGTGEVLAQAPLGGTADVDAAATAAVAAAPAWRKLAGADRGRLLDALAERMTARRAELAGLSVLNNGKLRSEAEQDVDDAIATYRHYAGVARHLPKAIAVGSVGEDLTMYRCFQPVGVSALIVPWNFPLMTTAWKVAPALAAGCTVILKPSEVTLLPEIVLGEIASAAGLPAGVLNIVPGAAAVGQAMVA